MKKRMLSALLCFAVCIGVFEVSAAAVAECQKGAHVLEHYDAVDATPSANGNIEYWYCTKCKCYYGDEQTTVKYSYNDDSAVAITAMASGQINDGDSSYWVLDSKGTFHATYVSGAGTFIDYSASASPEWVYQPNTISAFKIDSGITRIGNYCFADVYDGYKLATQLEFPSTITSIGTCAFKDFSSIQTIVFIGNAPEIGENAFAGITATAYYPANDNTWTADKRVNYGGTITWVAQGQQSGGEDPSATGKSIKVLLNGATITLSSESELTGTVYVAGYDSAGKMTELKTYPAADSVTAENLGEGTVSYTVMWLDDDMIPLSDTVSGNVN